MVWVVAALAALLSIVVLYPGQYPFDSAYQLWQARTGNYANVSPVAMPVLWSFLLSFGGDPASLLALNLAMYWCGLALCVNVLRGPAWLRSAFLLACGFWPLSLVQMAHLLTDAHLAAVLVLVSGLAAHAAVSGRRAPSWLALALLIYAGCIRHNAIAAVLPFGALFADRIIAGSRVRVRHRIAGIALLTTTSLLASIALDRMFVAERSTTWPTLALWDLASISIETNTLMLPDFTHGPDMTVAELVETGAFDPASNTLLFTRSRSGVAAGLMPEFTAEQLGILRTRWWSAVQAHPSAYLRHRLRTVWLLAGPHDGPVQGVAYFVERSRHGDNPELPTAIYPEGQARLYALAGRLRPGWLFSALPWLIVISIALVTAWRRRHDAVAGVAVVLASSAALYALSFFVLAPGAELRYLTWPIVIAPLALALACAGRAVDSSTRRTMSRL